MYIYKISCHKITILNFRVKIYIDLVLQNIYIYMYMYSFSMWDKKYYDNEYVLLPTYADEEKDK